MTQDHHKLRIQKVTWHVKRITDNIVPSHQSKIHCKKCLAISISKEDSCFRGEDGVESNDG